VPECPTGPTQIKRSCIWCAYGVAHRSVTCPGLALPTHWFCDRQSCSFAVKARPAANTFHRLPQYHGGLWGGWQYQVSDVDAATSTVKFGYGGYQEARGSGIGSNHFYIENLLEELDAPGEWYFNHSSSTLYYYPNTTASERRALPVLDQLIAVQGLPGAPVVGVSFVGLEFTETRATFMQQYEGALWKCKEYVRGLLRDGYEKLCPPQNRTSPTHALAHCHQGTQVCIG